MWNELSKTKHLYIHDDIYYIDIDLLEGESHMAIRIYNEMLGTNCGFTVYASEKRNENRLVIHSNNIGRNLFESDSVYDSDLLKIIRILDTFKNSSARTQQIVDKLNKNCRHLKITLI